MLCPHCKQEKKIEEYEKERLATCFSQEPKIDSCYYPVGCDACFEKGYIGRTGIFELFVIDDKIRDMIMKRVPSSLLQDYALKSGMRLLVENGYDKVANGTLSLSEFFKAVPQ